MAELKEVKKLDFPSRFDAIKSGLKTTSALKKHEIERYNVWYEYYKARGELVGPVKANILWVGDHWKTILKYINDVYTPPKSKGNTHRNHLEGLANVLLAIDKDKFKEITRPMFNLGLTTQQIIDKANEESKLDDREMANYVSYKTLVTKREEMAALWAANPDKLKFNMYHLILALNTYIPPLRLDWLDMNIYPPRLVDGKPKKVVATGPPPEGMENYLWEEKPGQWAIVINHDKIEGKREARDLPRQIMRLSDEIVGVTDGNKLNTIINQSLTWAPRNYVLIGIVSKGAMGASGFRSAMQGMFKPKTPLQNILRKAYINYTHRMKFNGMELPESKLKAIADRMRHSLEVARGSYRKINLGEENDDEKVVDPLPIRPTPSTLPIVPSRAPEVLPIVPPRVQPPVLIPPPVGPPVRPPVPVLIKAVVEAPKPFFVPKVYSAEYRVAHKETIARKKTAYYENEKFKILRAKILGNLNNGVVKEPKKSSVVKYQLRQNEETGKWYHLGGED